MRVPTYASQMNMLNQTMNNKATLDLYNFQTLTGLKAPTYAGYGMSAFSIVNMEASLKVADNFLENNKILGVEVKAMNTSMQSINNTINQFKSMLNSFSGMDLGGGTTSYTADTTTFGSNNDVYTGQSIVVNGTTYTFGADNTGNNIDISGLTPGDATYAQDVVGALKAKLEANAPDIAAKMTFKNNTFTYPINTVAQSSTVLTAANVSTVKVYTKDNNYSLQGITPDYTGGEISFTSNDNVYLGTTLTLDGVQYTFANDGNGNNIDISALTPGSATYGQDVMAALQNKVGALNADYKFDGNKFTFPLYTVNGTSSVLNSAGVKTGEPHTMSGDQYQSLQQLQQTAFSTMQMLADSLNISANGKYLFGGGTSNEPPVNFPFTTLKEFQAYYDGLNIKYPGNASANLSNIFINADKTGALTLQSDGGNNGTITSANPGGFLQERITANASTTGTLTFNSDKNTINATEYGAFNTYKAGDTLVLQDAGADHNGSYVIKSVSADGKTITFEDSTPIRADDQIVDGGGARFSSTYPVGAVIEMDGFGNNISPRVQVTGVSADGTQLFVKVDPSRFPTTPTVIPASSGWSMKSESYYQGGNLVSDKRISENQSISMDVTAENKAFEQLFRALGEIAQGNLVDTRNPKDEINGLIDNNRANERVNDALKLIQDAIYSVGSSDATNPDLNTITAKMSANSVILKNNDENLTLVKTNLENSVTSLKNVDQTEAAIKALLASTNLQASYQVLQNAMSISLLNYL